MSETAAVYRFEPDWPPPDVPWAEHEPVIKAACRQAALLRAIAACPAVPVVGTDAVDVRVPAALWEEITRAPAVSRTAGAQQEG